MRKEGSTAMGASLMDYPVLYRDYSRMNAVLAYRMSTDANVPHVIGVRVNLNCIPVGIQKTNEQINAFKRKHPRLSVRIVDGCLFMWLKVFGAFGKDFMRRLARSFRKHLAQLQILPIICELPPC